MKSFVLAALLVASPLAAQDAPLTRRVGTLETQMKAVQRKVFPGGDPRYFTPDIAPEAAPAASPQGSPATSPVADLTARVDALERQQRTLTGAVEEAQFKVRQLDEAFTKYRGDTDFRLNAIEHPAGTASVVPAPSADTAEATAPAPRRTAPATDSATASTPPVNEQWRSAYALYVAKDYPKAEAAMTLFVAANPRAPLASNAQYWLGRSYMVHDSYAQAAKAFLDGYKKYPKGERAPDSLLWLGIALTELNKSDEACRALNELRSVYGDKLTPALVSAATRARRDAKCGA